MVWAPLSSSAVLSHMEAITESSISIGSCNNSVCWSYHIDPAITIGSSLTCFGNFSSSLQLISSNGTVSTCKCSSTHICRCTLVLSNVCPRVQLMVALTILYLSMLAQYYFRPYKRSSENLLCFVWHGVVIFSIFSAMVFSVANDGLKPLDEFMLSTLIEALFTIACLSKSTIMHCTIGICVSGAHRTFVL